MSFNKAGKTSWRSRKHPDKPARNTYYREWYAKNRERWNAHVRARYQQKKVEILAKAKVRYHGRYRDSKLAKLYHITKEEARYWLDIMRCQICGAEGRRMSLDHDHSSGQIRGRLCSQCNRGLGLFKDSPDTLILAARYLQGHKEKAS